MLSDKPWKPDLVLRLLCGLFASMLLGSVIVMGYKSLRNLPPNAAPDFFIILLGVFTFHGIGLVLVDVFLRLHNITWSEAFGFKAPRLGRAIFLALIVGVLILPIAWELQKLSAQLLALFKISVQVQPVVKAVEAIRAPWYRAVQAVLIVVVAPFVEEVIFRGIIYSAIKQLGFRKAALWGSAIFFGLMHANLSSLEAIEVLKNLSYVLPLTVLGAILVFLYETTQNLLSPIVTHSLFNAVNYGILLWQMHKGPL